MSQVYVWGAFDDLRSRHIRFLEAAARRGPVTVALWPDELVRQSQGTCKFPFDERRYVLEAVRFVDQVAAAAGSATDLAAPDAAGFADGEAVWAVAESDVVSDSDRLARQRGLRLEVIPAAELVGFPASQFDSAHMDPSRKRVVVTGCYDWFHSGHVRFFEECAGLGDLYVVVGHDANVRLLKGEGHPLFPEAERRYVAGACRYVKHALITSGMGWMDAEPEIALIKPHMYAVNEDGDKPEKRTFCVEHGIEYVVLKRTPKEGLPRRSSTDLRGY